MKIGRPATSEYDAAFERYVSRVPEEDALPALERQPDELRRAVGSLPPERAGFRYAPGKWSVRELVGHVMDSERVFGYRALCVARGESAPLPGFEQTDYAANAGHDRYALGDLVAEFETVRRANVSMLAHLDETAILRIGTANGLPISVRALAFIMVGHFRHHMAVLADRYGISSGA
jgi:DinB superfamily